MKPMVNKWFLNPTTGKVVSYPEHFAVLKPYLVLVDEAPFCEDCMIPPEPESDATVLDESEEE